MATLTLMAVRTVLVTCTDGGCGGPDMGADTFVRARDRTLPETDLLAGRR